MAGDLERFIAERGSGAPVENDRSVLPEDFSFARQIEENAIDAGWVGRDDRTAAILGGCDAAARFSKAMESVATAAGMTSAAIRAHDEALVAQLRAEAAKSRAAGFEGVAEGLEEAARLIGEVAW